MENKEIGSLKTQLQITKKELEETTNTLETSKNEFQAEKQKIEVANERKLEGIPTNSKQKLPQMTF